VAPAKKSERASVSICCRTGRQARDAHRLNTGILAVGATMSASASPCPAAPENPLAPGRGFSVMGCGDRLTRGKPGRV
jgi:hypothetical protein